MQITTRPYESLLPFLVVEAISVQKTTFDSMSVQMNDKGWAWFVSGRKLLVWKYKETNTIKTRRMLSPCFDLQLPQSDLQNKADLVHVFFMPQNPNTSTRAITVPAALVVTPEGTIRFWSSIANERFTESSIVETQGLEFCTLAQLSPLQYLIGTTTGSIFLLAVDMTAHDSRSILHCSPLSAPSGLLSGIGRRVTNLFFGSIATDVGAESRHPLIAVPKYSQSTIDRTGSTDRPFFIMNSLFRLRQWSRTNEGANSANHLIREWDLNRNVYQSLISGLNIPDADKLNFWPIDMITTKSKELLILIVTLNTVRDNAINYATCTFNPYQAGESISSLTVLKSHSWNYSNETDDQLLTLKFLERRLTSNLCFLYDRKFLFLVQTDKDILDAIDYGNQDDSVLGAGIIDNSPILFTQRDGLIYVVPVVSNQSRLNETSLQLEPPIGSSTLSSQFRRDGNASAQLPHSTSTQLDPMVVELDEEEDEENQDSSRLATDNNQSKQHLPTDSNASTSNKSANQSSLNRSVNHSIRRRDEVSEVLRENKEFEWVQQINSKQYGAASETLAKLAIESEHLQDRKETLVALSKIAKLAE